MDYTAEIAKLLIATSPIAAVILLLGTSVLQVIKTDLADANAKRSVLNSKLNNINLRLVEIEDKLQIPQTPDSVWTDDNPFVVK